MRVSEGTRTPDRLDHNQELYQLSYAHHVRITQSSGAPGPAQESRERSVRSASADRKSVV